MSVIGKVQTYFENCFLASNRKLCLSIHAVDIVKNLQYSVMQKSTHTYQSINSIVSKRHCLFVFHNMSGFKNIQCVYFPFVITKGSQTHDEFHELPTQDCCN